MTELDVKVKELDEQALFAQALDVMNRVLRENRDRTPYKQILEASEKLLDDELLGVAITKEPGGDPYDYYTVRFRDGTFELVGRGKRDDPRLTWTVSRDYLETVVGDPERYVENPAKLDLDWIKSVLGIG